MSAPFCASSPEAAHLSDAEFWRRVAGQMLTDRQESDPDHDPIGGYTAAPCPECGSVTACGYDAEGRPMIHATEETA